MICPTCSRAAPDDAATRPSCGAMLANSTASTIPQPPPSPNYNRPSSSNPYSEGRFIAGAILAERYRIIGLLGKGGMGEVYKAEDLKLSQTVALKFLPRALALDGPWLARFHGEVRISRQVSHPNVCRVHDIGEAEGFNFISMEFIDGEDLSSLLRRIGRLPGDKAVEIARQICAWLAAAHDSGVLHRDLKPANVMIDGRGKARITDFGLAVVSEELRGEEVLSGTPAYMAPEQLAGKEVTVKSDVYSLGLVLYELFTGKRAFESNNVGELIKERERSSPPSPSTLIKDIDPLAERVIMRCLEKDPRQRPASAAQVALALPGGDPLQAALAAGETPSPEIVAAAGEKEGMRPAAALFCLVAIIIGLIATGFLNRRVSLIEKVPFDNSPEVLARKGREIIALLGYPDRPADSAYGMIYNNNYLEYVRKNDQSPDRWRQLEKGRPAPIYFWYRESPRYLTSIQWVSRGDVTEDDPPQNQPGMVNIHLDTLGRLIRLDAAPPRVDKSNSDGSATPSSAPDWKMLFSQAGLDISRFAPAEPQWTPHSVCDTRAAWTGAFPERTDYPMRVEAAAYRGRFVYFDLIEPWRTPEIIPSLQPGKVREIVDVFVISLLSCVFIGAALLARRNFRQGRGDRQGAFRLAVFIFVIRMLFWLFQASHVPNQAEGMLFSQAVAQGLLSAGAIWVHYLALEPFVRRRWPTTIISWSKILAGNFRDPLVGRDLLIGALCGVSIRLLLTLKDLIGNRLGDIPRGVLIFSFVP